MRIKINKDIKALFHVAYYFYQTTLAYVLFLRHNKQQILTLLYLLITTLLMRAPARELLVPFLMHLAWRSRDSNPRSTVPEADDLLLQLPGQVDRYIYIYIYRLVGR